MSRRKVFKVIKKQKKKTSYFKRRDRKKRKRTISDYIYYKNIDGEHILNYSVHIIPKLIKWPIRNINGCITLKAKITF